MKQIQPIRNKKDCDAATHELERLMDEEASKKLTKAEAARLELLATLVDGYESALVEDVPPDPIEALKFRLEQMGLPFADLARTLGSRSRARSSAPVLDPRSAGTACAPRPDIPPGDIVSRRGRRTCARQSSRHSSRRRPRSSATPQRRLSRAP